MLFYFAVINASCVQYIIEGYLYNNQMYPHFQYIRCIIPISNSLYQVSKWLSTLQIKRSGAKSWFVFRWTFTIIRGTILWRHIKFATTMQCSIAGNIPLNFCRLTGTHCQSSCDVIRLSMPRRCLIWHFLAHPECSILYAMIPFRILIMYCQQFEPIKSRYLSFYTHTTTMM